ncbi:hypothetical protein [Buchananella hordeovulneris]|uniref:hypothetical protein n=1 Tax=Buchananella hordeovulneris TaxID=52770 RepID=UPI000F5EC4FC|nr:hypothetical protein [Buchananella hordeovulneris]MDO5081278.1 hypothetical protein [Buchananella hordeovulneris]RRD43329.1 hypothetical protein EII13_07475 [Buchananella hordeovulneris]RRD50660.1 hypothetical protein EII12_09305 [Buchananella hordeovulneris]
MQCADGIIISQGHATVLRPDREGKVAVLVSGPSFEDGIATAAITVSFPGTNKPGADRPLRAGESVSHPEVGTLTLLDVKVVETPPGQVGGGNLAVYCFRPTPTFDLDTDRLTWTKDQ